jgi:phage/plasmid-associated DNA primase
LVKKPEGVFTTPIGFDPTKALTEDILLDTNLEEFIESVEKLEPGIAGIKITEYLVLTNHLIDKTEIRNRLSAWQKFRNYNLDSKSLNKIVDHVWSDKKTFAKIKSIAKSLGENKTDIMLERDQLIEVSEWIMGRYYVKRIELTGDLLFFNDQYYEKNAEALIRRNARACISKSKNNDMNEVVKYIEDSCQVLSGKDIEKFVHLKCLLNGTYDIIKGKFTASFNPENIILNQIPRNFVKKGRYTTIEKRISEIIPNKFDRQSYFDFGSTCLHPYTGIDFQLGTAGIAGTGKTQLSVLLQLVFGSDNVTNATIHRIAEDPTTQKDVAYSFLNIDEELKSDDVKNLETLKKWITQGRMTARGIYGHNTNFRPTTRLMFATNTIYEIANPDDALAIYERTHLIKLTQKMRHTKKEIKNVFETIKEKELDSFISYLLKNATKIYKKKSITYPQTTFETESLWNEFGNEVRHFIDTWLEKGVGLKEESSEIWNRFFQEQNSRGLHTRGKNQFYKKFDEVLGSTAIQVRDGEERYWGYLGVKLRTIDQKDRQEKIDQTPKGWVFKKLNTLDDTDPLFKEVKRLLK